MNNASVQKDIVHDNMEYQIQANNKTRKGAIMSKRVQAVAVCPQCDSKFKVEIYRTVWGEREDFRYQIASDEINLVLCPTCNASIHCASSLLYNDTDIQFAVWWEPRFDAEIDTSMAYWREKFGPNLYLCNAPRIQDWLEFKTKIAQAYGYASVEELLKTNPTRKYNKIEIPKAQSKNCVPDVPKPKVAKQSRSPLFTSGNGYHTIRTIKKDMTLNQESFLSSVFRLQFFGRTTAIVFLLISLVLAIALVVISVDSNYYPGGNYSVDQQVQLSREFLWGENRVANYEKAYFWTLIANANGAYLYHNKEYIEKRLNSRRVKSIQKTAEKWQKKHKE